jgi:hypothetical protein
MGSVRTPSGPRGVLRGQAAARGLRHPDFKGGGGEVEGRCTSRGDAKPAVAERPNALLGRHPGATLPPAQRPSTQRPILNAQRPSTQRPILNTQRPGTQRPPNAQRPAAASPTLHLAQRRAYHRSARERGFRTLYRSRCKGASSPVNAPGVALPRAQRPTPNARETQRLTPKS